MRMGFAGEQLSGHVAGMATSFPWGPGFAQASAIQWHEDRDDWRWKAESGGC